MHEKGCTVDIDGCKHQLVYNTQAMAEIMEKFGDVESLADRLQGNHAETVRIMPWLIALLANQGVMLETGDTKPTNPALITPEWVALHTAPTDLLFLMGECMTAIAMGNGTYHEAPEEGPVDVVLEEIEKNAEAGGE